MKIKFLLAEEFRPEVNNKLAVLGLFAGDTIIFTKGPQPAAVPAEAPYGIERLSIMVNVSDIEGIHSYKGLILDPNKHPIGKERLIGDGIVIKKGMDHSFVFEMKPFVFKLVGTYTFILTVDDKPHEFPFEIRLGEQAPN